MSKKVAGIGLIISLSSRKEPTEIELTSGTDVGDTCNTQISYGECKNITKTSPLLQILP